MWRTNHSFLQLHNGDRVAIIGGGPAGSFFALHLLRFAERANLKLNITIYDAKNFLLTGPRGCNLCAGVISANLVGLLEGFGLNLDEARVQRKIKGYYLQTPLAGVQLFHPDYTVPIYSVFRGNGPRYSSPDGNISFDDFLLQHAISQGVVHQQVQVLDVQPGEAPEQPVTFSIATEKGKAEKRTAELLVLACGLNSPLLKKLAQTRLRYRPPKWIATVQAELPLPEEWIARTFRNNIVVFSFRSRRIRYAVVVPKKNYLSISIITRGDAEYRDLYRFLHSDIFLDYLPNRTVPAVPFCHCRPRIAATSAHHPFDDRIVFVGDVSYTRIYKNGIESAFFSARQAAQTAVERGISRAHFRRFYHRPMKRAFVRDNRFGRLIFLIYDLIVKHDFLSQVFVRSLLQTTSLKMRNNLRRFVWSMFTGQERYQRILLRFLRPEFQLFMLLQTLGYLWRREVPQKTAVGGPTTIWRATPRLGPLQNGATVGIIGGGPGGIAAAIMLQKIACERQIDVHTVIYEGKTYSGVPHYNQCVGVLSPPIREILEKQLDIPFPEHLVQRPITGYRLMADRETILLLDEDNPSYSVRRITFDDYLLSQALQKGVEVRHSRVTDIEFHAGEVTIYSETDCLHADAVVGAFGLDDGSIQMFERTCGYRAPKFLYSIVTKVHPQPEFMEQVSDQIYAFLPPFHPIEFGAITPKQNHLTINIAGKNVNTSHMDWFLNYPPVRVVLPRWYRELEKQLYYFKGKFPVSLARNFFGDRFVLVGDAAGLVRPFKGKGINSALLSGIAAAQVMMHEGISKQAFQRYRESCQEILRDFPYGFLMRRLAIVTANHGLLDFFVRFGKVNEAMYWALFNSVSAHKYYREILLETLSWPFVKEAIYHLYKFQSEKFHGR